MISIQNNICIIPARGGSKRIHRKNIKSFAGKPIIAYSIETALASGLFREVMVSTDDLEIKQIALKYGAKVPFIRSDENANDHAILADVVDEVIDNYRLENELFEYACCILPTAPFVTVEMLREAYSTMLSKSFDSVRPIVRFGYPIQRALRFLDGKVELAEARHIYSRSQDLEPMYHDAGLFYWCRTEIGLRGANKGGFVISQNEAQDIDSQDDWDLAELKFRLLKDE